MDAVAFERLVAEHQQMVYCVALSHCKDRAAAEDVAQEAFLKAFKSIGRLRNPSQAKTWLYSIARFTAIDWLRRRRFEVVAEVPEQAAPEDDRAEGRSMRVMDVIQGLREDYREIMLLRYVRDLSYAEIARELGLSTAAVGEKLFRVREMIRWKMQAEVQP